MGAVHAHEAAIRERDFDPVHKGFRVLADEGKDNL